MIPCEYINLCPCSSGWCNIHHPDQQCVKHLLAAYSNLRNTTFNQKELRLSELERLTENDNKNSKCR